MQLGGAPEETEGEAAEAVVHQVTAHDRALGINVCELKTSMVVDQTPSLYHHSAPVR